MLRAKTLASLVHQGPSATLGQRGAGSKAAASVSSRSQHISELLQVRVCSGGHACRCMFPLVVVGLNDMTHTSWVAFTAVATGWL
jgi:hypothetical protein